MEAFFEALAKVQAELKAPKDKNNQFGGYKYRSAETILALVKPLLAAKGLSVNLTDEMLILGDRYYLKATATITDGKNKVCSSAFAREPIAKKGMDESQITGSASSYARKYALSGLLGIDDSAADPDNPDNHADNPEVENREKKLQHDRDVVARKAEENVKAKLASLNDLESLMAYYRQNAKALAPYMQLLSARKKELLQVIQDKASLCMTVEDLEKLQNETKGGKLKEVDAIFKARFTEINDAQIQEAM